MAENDRIELIIEGLPEHEGRVRLNTFMAQLQHLGAALTKLDKESNDGKAGSIFNITALSYNSPMRVVLEAAPVSSQLFTGHLVVESLKRVSNAVKSGDSLLSFDSDILEEFHALAKPIGKSLKHTTLLFNGEVLDFTPKIYQQLESALAVDEECEGSIEGMLEQINVHRGANTFQIFPEVGPNKVTCHFPPKMYDDAVSAVGRRVEVSGILKYRTGASFAHQISVANIDVQPFDHDLPDWDDLRGRAPDATGLLTSEAFVRELRDAW